VEGELAQRGSQGRERGERPAQVVTIELGARERGQRAQRGGQLLKKWQFELEAAQRGEAAQRLPRCLAGCRGAAIIGDDEQR
jgi:hypothetical protein